MKVSAYMLHLGTCVLICDENAAHVGTAREAARLFPKNSNVVATLAIATAGLDHVQAAHLTPARKRVPVVNCAI